MGLVLVQRTVYSAQKGRCRGRLRGRRAPLSGDSTLLWRECQLKTIVIVAAGWRTLVTLDQEAGARVQEAEE